MCASDDHQARALSDLVEQYSWEKVGIVGTKGIYGQELANSVSNMLNEGAIQVTTNQHFKAREEDLTQQVNAVSIVIIMICECRGENNSKKSIFFELFAPRRVSCLLTQIFLIK